MTMYAAPAEKHDLDLLPLMRDLDRRMRNVELWIAARQSKGTAAFDADGRPIARRRGRPPGSQTLPKIQVSPPLFPEHDLDTGELVALSAVQTWLRQSRAPGATPLWPE